MNFNPHQLGTNDGHTPVHKGASKNRKTANRTDRQTVTYAWAMNGGRKGGRMDEWIDGEVSLSTIKRFL